MKRFSLAFVLVVLFAQAPAAAQTNAPAELIRGLFGPVPRTLPVDFSEAFLRQFPIRRSVPARTISARASARFDP